MSAFGAPSIRFATTSDGLTIAHTTFGSGPPLVVPPGWVSHLEHVFDAQHGRFMSRLGQSHTVITYDGRGTGLSDRNVTDFNVPARLRDLEAVIEQLGLERFSMFAWSQSTPSAMVYAVDHPDKVDRLILFSPFCGGHEGSEKDAAVLRALLDLMRAEWGIGARATMGFVHPDADREEMQEDLAFLRVAASGDVAAGILEEDFMRTDVRAYLPRIAAPTLVLHRRDDKAVDAESGRIVASLIPGSRFVLLDGDHHLPYDHDAEPVLRAIEEFLGVPSPEQPEQAHTHSHAHDDAHPDAPITLLFTDMEGSTSLTQRLGDAQAQELLRLHDTIVREALRAHGGSEVKHTGDGIMASFVSASGALECAVRIQRALAEHYREQHERPVQLRIGLNAGEPVRESGDLFGTAVQLARRICDQAQPGQILAANVVRELAAGKGFLFADLGEVVPKGFEDPVRLYAVRWEE
jgi:class 3 adenylate cyclase/pimeloyl-ACP methyl ester carboxylesterase